MAPKAEDGRLRDRVWRRFLRGQDPELLEQLYVPALSEGIRYDRCCAYFSSSVLAAAARGFGELLSRLDALGEEAPHPAVRLLVNEELAAQDVRALTETGDTSRLEAVLQRRFKSPKDALQRDRLAMLGWLVKCRLLEVRVGVMRRGEGILHAKFGIVTDQAGDAVVFSGSGNESAVGLIGNYERLEISTSWDDPDRQREYMAEFAALWLDEHPDVHTVPLPEALRLRLVRLAREEVQATEPSSPRRRQQAAMVWRFLTEAPFLEDGGAACDATALVDLWPHQRRVVEETAAAWPDGRLLCDEVGMGKTIEAMLILRRLLAGRGVRRALLLLPAGLLKQWQSELREKGGMVFPRLEGTHSLVWPDGRSEKVEGLAEALECEVVLVSREAARTESNAPVVLAATPWDLVVLDESHAARRRQQEEGEFNSGTLLLELLRQLQLRQRARGFLLLSATPMQTHPWEPWDLLGVLGEGGAWLAEFAGVRAYYETIAAVRGGRCDLNAARQAASLIAVDPEFPGRDGGSADEIARRIAFAPPTQREERAVWLRRGSPLARRMHRNTRQTLRRYYEQGVLPSPPPTREVVDILFDFDHAAEREVYNAVTRYIDRRFAELERERAGKGFVMTIYRRRASSSPYALEQSLERRRDGLRRVADRRAYAAELTGEEIDLRDLDDVGEIEGRVSAALPEDPQVARAELHEVESLLAELRNLPAQDSKLDRFFDVLRQVSEDGRAVLVFTEYSDTLTYLRNALEAHYGRSLACYSGDGGQVWDGEAWQAVTKDAITRRLQAGDLRVLVCTDAASEGLNLQAAGAVINYDLPWNPSKVEQRIGRIDRIGQRLPRVRIANLFLRDSVDDRVYRVLRQRCGLFEHFVGAMQPVLAKARRMLLGREAIDTGDLESQAATVEGDPLAGEAYVDGPAEVTTGAPVSLTRQDMAAALGWLDGQAGFRARREEGSDEYVVSGPGFPRTSFTCGVESLERHPEAQPLSPLDPRFRDVADFLARSGERLPLVVGAAQSGAFRRSVAYWVSPGTQDPVESMSALVERVEAWDGTYPEPTGWLQAQERARREATDEVQGLQRQAAEREQEGLRRQREAARLRLLRELGRYLICLDGDTGDLNRVLYEQMTRDVVSADRLRRCHDRLGGYPEWAEGLLYNLQAFRRNLTDNQRRGRLLGRELDAALDDPRWGAADTVAPTHGEVAPL